uniref:Uncharacterized protein n=1 Tax=Panagrolaimus sp. JU765 TaxID=591449 RepID=A0AC34R7M5_9BILA
MNIHVHVSINFNQPPPVEPMEIDHLEDEMMDVDPPDPEPMEFQVEVNIFIHYIPPAQPMEDEMMDVDPPEPEPMEVDIAELTIDTLCQLFNGLKI